MVSCVRWIFNVYLKLLFVVEYQNAAIVKLKSSLLECIDSIDVNEKVTVLATATESQAFDR